MEKRLLEYMCFVLTVIYAKEGRTIVKIGAIFDYRSTHLIKQFQSEVQRLTVVDNDLIMKGTHETVDCQDSFNVSNAICHLLEQRVYGMLGAFQTCALTTIQSYTDTFNVPFIALSMPQLSSSEDPYQLYIRPSYIAGVLDIVSKKQWKKIYYIYESNEGLVRLQQLFQVINKKEMNLDIVVKRIVSVQFCHQMLRGIYNTEIKEDLRLLIDLTMTKSEELISAIKNDPDISNVRFHFVLIDLGIKDMNETVLSEGMNVSGFSLPFPKSHNPEIQPVKKGTFGELLVQDAVETFYHALQKARPISDNKNVHAENCRDNMIKITVKPGKRILKAVRSIEFDGQSGRIIFDDNGLRKDFKLPLYETRMNLRVSKVGDYKAGRGLHTHQPESPTPTPSPGDKSLQEKIRRIVTVAEPPYVMYTTEAEKMVPKPICGIDNFKGYIVDLIRAVAENVNFNYTVCLAETYGIKLDNSTWTGVIGQLTRNMADIGFGGMTISSERERVVDFTKPFMSLGISIMIKKPENKKTHTFSFMDPLSYEIWMCILFAYVGVSVVLFLVSRFSPTEWQIDDDKTITNAFTISNSLWYSLGAFMQQGCDISPKSVSGRIVGSVWWFFTLIIISSYTANLAAFLTVERMNTPIDSAEDLAKQTKIRYGTYEGGTTSDFFRLSKVAVYERMWAYMTTAKDVFVPTTQEGIKKVREQNGKYAYLMESVTNEYTNSRKPCDTMKVGSNLDSKGYGIATPIGSDLRDRLTLAVLHLREKGVLQSLKKKWWEETSECGKPSSVSAGSEAELKLTNVAGIFYILIGGLSLSIIIAGLEFLYRSIVDSRKSQEAFGTIVRNKARLSFRGSIDAGHPDSSTPLNQSGISGTYTYTGPKEIPGFDPYESTNEETNMHTEV